MEGRGKYVSSSMVKVARREERVVCLDAGRELRRDEQSVPKSSGVVAQRLVNFVFVWRGSHSMMERRSSDVVVSSRRWVNADSVFPISNRRDSGFIGSDVVFRIWTMEPRIDEVSSS